MNEKSIIKDAFYTVDLHAFVRGDEKMRCYDSHEKEVFRDRKIIFIPDILNDPETEKKTIASLKKTLQLEVITAYNSGVYSHCEHYNARIYQEYQEKYQERWGFMTVEATGGIVPRGFVPQCKVGTEFIIGEEYVSEFLEQKFTGVDVRKINMKGTYFSTPMMRKKMNSLSLYEGIVGDYYLREPYLEELRKIEFVCDSCGKAVAIYCEECNGFIIECPECGKKDMTFKGNAIERLCTIEFNTTDRYDNVYFTRHNEWGITKPNCRPFRGEMWNRNDFFGENVMAICCTGKVAKWLIERQFGHMALIPNYVDVSKCNDDQREFIESVRFSPY